MNSLVNGQTIIMERYIIFGVGIYLLGIAWACSYLPHIIRYALSVLLVILAAVSAFSHISKTYTAHAGIKAWETIVNNMDKPYVYCPKYNDAPSVVFRAYSTRHAIPVFNSGPLRKNFNRLNQFERLLRASTKYKYLHQIKTGESILVDPSGVKAFETQLHKNKQHASRMKHQGYWLYTIKGQES